MPGLAAKGVTTTIPIVMMSFPDPVGCRFGRQFGPAGRQCHGIVEFNKRAEQQETRNTEGRNPEAFPSWSSAARRETPDQQTSHRNELWAAAPVLKIKLEEIETDADSKGLERAFRTAKQKQVKAIMTTTTNFFFAERKRIVELAGTYRLPAIYFQKEFVDEGGLMSYGGDFSDQYRRAAVYVDKILEGAKPADLPVEAPTKFELVINLKKAQQLGLTIPNNVLAKTDRVIR